jgi:hypothetical protein
MTRGIFPARSRPARRDTVVVVGGVIGVIGGGIVIIVAGQM